MKSWIRLLTGLAVDLNRLRPHMRPNRWLVAAVVATSMLAALFEGAGIGLLIPLVALSRMQPAELLAFLEKGRYLHWLPDLFPHRSAGFYVGVFCVLVLLSIIAKNGVQTISLLLTSKFSRRIAANLREAIFHRMQHASIHIFEERKSGEMGNLFSIETIRTQNAVEYVVLLVQRCLLGLCYIGFIILLSWRLSLGLAVLAVVVGGSGLLLQSGLKRRGDQRSSAQLALFGYLAEIFSGIRVVRANNAQGMAEAEFKRLNHRMADVERQGSVLGGIIGPVTEVLAMAGAMTLVGWAYIALIQHNLLSGDQLMVVGVVLIRILPLMNQVYGVMGQISYTSGGVREALRWLDSPLFPSRPFGAREWAGVRGSIRLEGVGYTYPNGTVALEDISFEIPAGNTVALVGSSGSGKSTIASLLLRLREPTAGRIVADGVDFWEFSPASWHARLGMVEQEAFLFHDTVAANICFGRPDVTPEQLRRAVSAAHLGDVIRGLPAGLETVVGERGAMFSGGQRQRLAIARAIVADPQLLILDEATSALDNVSERLVQTALDEARHHRTVVVIAHRLSTVRSADRIVVLDRGRVVESGTWDELTALGGHFSRLLKSAEPGTDSLG